MTWAVKVKNFFMVLFNQTDRDLGGVPQGIAEALIGDALGETLDTNNFNGLLATIAHEERDLPFA